MEKLAPGIVPEVEVSRVRAERVRREQEVERAKERWEVSSAGLSAVLRLDGISLLSPMEPPHLILELVDTAQPADEMREAARGMRPELGAQAASIEASNMRLKQERARPFIPSILLRGAATNPSGTLAGGVFGGGINDSLNDFAGRNSVDVQILWEMKNLGMGNVALVRERKAQRELAEQELVKIAQPARQGAVRAGRSRFAICSGIGREKPARVGPASAQRRNGSLGFPAAGSRAGASGSFECL